MLGLFSLLLLGASIWFWMDSLRAREFATELAQRICQRHGVQFLDGTVSLERLGLARSAHGNLSLRRWYRFDYSVEGLARQRGHVVLKGQALDSAELNHRPPIDGE